MMLFKTHEKFILNLQYDCILLSQIGAQLFSNIQYKTLHTFYKFWDKYQTIKNFKKNHDIIIKYETKYQTIKLFYFGGNWFSFKFNRRVSFKSGFFMICNLQFL